MSYSDWIRSGTNRFGFNSVRVVSGSGLHRVNKSSSQFGFDSDYIGIWVITISSWKESLGTLIRGVLRDLKVTGLSRVIDY